MNIAFVIQARMKSTRLPGKVLLPLPFNDGSPIIKIIIDTLNNSSFKGRVIVATSVNIENNIISNYCEENSIECFRGNEDDVLSRFVEIAKKGNYDAIVRLTADNPLIDIQYLDHALHFHFDNQNDYTNTVGLPLGMNFEIISSSTLLSLEKETTDDYDKEHVTPFIRNNNKFKKKEVTYEVDSKLKDLRLTVDQVSDYLTLSAMLTLGRNEKLTGISLVTKILNEFPWIFDANNTVMQKKRYNDLSSELTMAIKLLEIHDMGRSAQLLKNVEF